jgi:uncharacterized repeat protein (TIGR03803 family)
MMAIARFQPKAQKKGLLFFLFWTVAYTLAPIPAEAADRQIVPEIFPAALSHLTPLRRLPTTQHLSLAISLPLRNQTELTGFLKQLQDPTSPNFRHYLTPAQFAARFGPTQGDYDAVIAFAQSHGLKVTNTHPNRLIVDVDGAVPDIESAFHVTMQSYQHPTEGRQFFAPNTQPSLDLAVPILHIGGLENYSLPHPYCKAKPLAQNVKGTPFAQTGSGLGGSYAGTDFRAAYVPGTTLTGTGQSIGLVEFDGYYPSDIQAYETAFSLPNVNLVNVPVDGYAGSPGSANVEVALDIELSIAMAPGISNVYVYEAQGDFGSHWDDLLNQMTTDDVAKQLSCSWGGNAPDATAEMIFQQMAAQGQSFLTASGDSDAYTSAIPFPSDSPNVTVVGGTTLSTTGAGGSYTSETVWNSGGGLGSSGGISTYYLIPTYQQSVSMAANGGSTTMRNIPDVSMVADDVYVTYNKGGSEAVVGTSCSAPLWAGFMALVNQQATANGFSTVGFLNPSLYGIGATFPSDFHDTTAGNNFTSSSSAQFSATTGYDLCTGWGSPVGNNLISILAGSRTGAPTITSARSVSGVINTAFSYQIAATNHPTSYSYNSGTLPAGLTLNTTTGLISGTLTAVASTSFTISATNGSGTGSTTLTINATQPPGPVIANMISLASFNGTNGNSPSATPYGVVQESDGNFYGAARSGGTNDYGTLFKMTPTGSLTSLCSFTGSSGAFPGEYAASLIVGSDGNFYGTTGAGGANGDGTLFKMTPSGIFTTLCSFNDTNGKGVYSGVVQGTDGNFYGTSSYGAIFRVTPSGAITLLDSLGSSLFPNGLVQGGDGNFYGTNQFGGTSNYGTVFKVTPAGVLTTLLSFNGTNGEYPITGLTLGRDGNFYGTTGNGGASTYGTIFKMTPAGTLTTLFSFSRTNGDLPSGPLLQGTDGNFYGIAQGGGANNYGTVFMITPGGSFTSLATFNAANGQDPISGLIQGSDGNIYGTTLAGGSSGDGAVFTLTPDYLNATALIGAPFTYRVLATNNPTSFATGSGLPPGLGINPGTGVISGTPTATGTFSAVIQATNGGGTGSQVLTITVLPPAPVINSSLSVTGTIGSAFSYQITATNNPTSFSSGWLPPGLSLNTTTGVISGIPTATGTSTLNIYASNGATGSAVLNINVPGAPSITSGSPPTAFTGVPYSFTLISNSYPAPTFSITSGALPTGLTISSAGVISGTPSAVGTFTGTITANNGVAPVATQNFSIAVQTLPQIKNGPPPNGTLGTPYSFTFTYSGSPAPTFSVTSGSLPAGLTLSSAGVISGTPVTTGLSIGIITASNGAGATQSFSIAIQGAPVFNNGPPPPGVLNASYTFTYSLSGYPTPTFSLTSGALPTGLTLSSAGVISGTPTVSGIYTGTVTASNGLGTAASQSFSITVAAQQAPSITNGPPPAVAGNGVTYSFTYTTSGFPPPTLSVTSGVLPPGLSFSAAGVMTGTPTTNGIYTGTVTATNGIGTAATQNFSITVQSANSPSIKNGPPPNASLNVAYNFSYISTGSPPPTFSVTSGTLPPGLSLSSAGVISGTPTVTGSYPVTITAANAVSNAIQTFNMTVTSIPANAPFFNSEPAVTGGTSNTVSWTSVNGTLQYEVQASTSSTFTTVLDSGWMTGTSYTFNGLTSGVTYYYRVRGRNMTSPDGLWSQLSQSQLALDSLSNVVISPAGATLLPLTSTATSGVITNPSFEQSTGSLGWTTASQGNFFEELGTSAASPMPTNGSTFLELYTSYFYLVSNGDNYAIGQTVNLTGITSIQFDAVLGVNNEWNNQINLEFLIDGNPVWTQTSQGNYLNQAIPVSGLTGIHTIAFKATALTAFSSTYAFLGIDNLRTYTGTYNSTGSLTSTTIAPSSLGQWGILSFSGSTAATGTALTVDVLSPSGTLLASNVGSGTDLSTLPAVASATSIQLRANLSTSNSANTPALTNWSVSDYGNTISPWSTSVSSLQGSTPAITNGPPPATATAGVAYNFTFTASGTPLPSFTVTGGALPGGLTLSLAGAITGTPTTPGIFSGTITADNTLEPAATQNFSITVHSTFNSWATQEILTGDSALPTSIISPDGITNLMKYALGLDPFTTYNPGSASLPQVQILDISGAKYLTLTFTGNVTDVTYNVQVSNDLVNWSPVYIHTGTPAPGTVTVQDTQDITVSLHRYLRLRVSQ